MSAATTYDVAVVGAGVFGAWTAWHLAKRGQRVLLLDAYGPAHSRASSGGESRIIRMGYGADELYTRWSQRSLVQWKQLFAATAQPLFHQTGVLWLAHQRGPREQQTLDTLTRCGVPHRVLGRDELTRRYSQISLDAVNFAIFEPDSGVLLARRAVAAVCADARRLGAEYRQAQTIAPAATAGDAQQIQISDAASATVRHEGSHGASDAASHEASHGASISAKQFVFACGPWLGKLFPEILGPRIFPTRQEIFFFGVPAGDARFAPSALPTWLFQEDQVYGMPDIESRGLKIAFDQHGERVDPDTQSRLPSTAAAEQARRYVAHRFPALRDAQIVEARVCQYENTSSGDFLVDRHPVMPNVWFVGGGSGHGFKHGPAMGEYAASQVLGDAPGEPRFLLSAKDTIQNRAVY